MRQKRWIYIFTVIAIIVQTFGFAAFADSTNYGTNICLGKKAFCSGGYGYGFDLECINDGNYGTNFANGGDVNPVPSDVLDHYAAIDLDGIYRIDRIILYTRTDLNAEWARKNISVGVATKSDFSDLKVLGTKSTPGEFKSTLNVKTSGDVYARYVLMIGNGCIAELEAYGEPATVYEKGSYSDISGAKYVNAARLLTQLDIMGEETAGKFEPYNLITRGEAAAYAVKISKGSEIPYENDFADVSNEHKYANYIKAALEYGFVSSDENFRPDDYVTKEELLTMMLKVSGYYKRTEFTSLKLEWPDNVLFEAKKIGLLKGCEIENYVSKRDMALVMYNLLVMPSFAATGFSYDSGGMLANYSENGETYLEAMFDYRLISGVVTADAFSSLSQELEYDEGRLDVGEKTYKNTSSTKKGLLGRRVFALLDEDENAVMVWKDEEKSVETVVSSEDISKVERDSITVYKNDKEVRYKVSNPYTLKNNIASQNITEADYKSLNGKVEFIDYNDDGTYEVINVLAPKVIVVSSVYYGGSGMAVDIRGENGENLRMDDYELIGSYDSKGNEADLAGIKYGALIYAYVSDSGNYAELKINTNSVSGIVEKVQKDSLFIDETEYIFTDYFDKTTTDKNFVGKNASFVLDPEGKVVYMLSKAIKQEKEFAAIIRGIGKDGFYVKFDVFDDTGKFEVLKAANKVRLNGGNVSADDLESMGSGFFKGKIAILKTNSSGDISSITTENATDTDSVLYKRTVDIDGAYRADVGYFVEGEPVMTVPASDETVAFRIPVDEDGNLLTSTDYKTYYSVTTLSEIYPHARESIDAEGVKLFGSDEFGAPYYATVPKKYGSGLMDYDVISNLNDRDALVLTDIMHVMGDDGTETYALAGYDLSSGIKKEVEINSDIKRVVDSFKITNYTAYPEITGSDVPHSNGSWWYAEHSIVPTAITDAYKIPIEDLKVGDIIRWSVRGSTKGARVLERVFSIEKADDVADGVVYSCGDLPNTIFSSFRLKYGTVDKFSKEHFYLKDGEVLNAADFLGAVIEIDRANEKVYAYTNTSPGSFINDGTRVVLYSQAAKFYSTVVIK